MKRITYNWLKKREACIEHRMLFKELYPNGLEVCWMCLQEAQQRGFDVDWLVDRLAYKYWAQVLNAGHPRRKRFPKLAKQFGYDQWVVYQLRPEALQLLEKLMLRGRCWE